MAINCANAVYAIPVSPMLSIHATYRVADNGHGFVSYVVYTLDGLEISEDEYFTVQCNALNAELLD